MPNAIHFPPILLESPPMVGASLVLCKGQNWSKGEMDNLTSENQLTCPQIIIIKQLRQTKRDYGKMSQNIGLEFMH